MADYAHANPPYEPVLPRDKQKERRIKKYGLALTARTAAVLAIYPNRIGIGKGVRGGARGSRIGARSHDSDLQRVRLNPPAPAIDGLHVLSEVDDILTDGYPRGFCGIAIEATRHAAV